MYSIKIVYSNWEFYVCLLFLFTFSFLSSVSVRLWFNPVDETVSLGICWSVKYVTYFAHEHRSTPLPCSRRKREGTRSSLPRWFTALRGIRLLAIGVIAGYCRSNLLKMQSGHLRNGIWGWYFWYNYLIVLDAFIVTLVSDLLTA